MLIINNILRIMIYYTIFCHMTYHDYINVTYHMLIMTNMLYRIPPTS